MLEYPCQLALEMVSQKSEYEQNGNGYIFTEERHYKCKLTGIKSVIMLDFKNSQTEEYIEHCIKESCQKCLYKKELNRDK